ncbi:MAG: hypothetical protein IJ730_01535 [Alphaproteobacteria bacterium]|nr:hypothetical protein [Alphaproteobacteria bacterium]
MKRFLFITLLGIWSVSLSYGMHQPPVSFHSIVENHKNQQVRSHPICENEEELQKRIIDNTKRFISAAPLEKKM